MTPNTSGRLRAGVTATLREFLREPVNLALLVMIPPVIIISYGGMLAAFPAIPGLSGDPRALGTMAGTLFVAAFLPAVIGLFQVISARQADERLVLTGFPRVTLFGARLVAVGVASLCTATIALVVFLIQQSATAPFAGFAVLVFVGTLYGLIGMLIGAVLPRELEGSLVLIFLADFDEALASGVVHTDIAITTLLPLHYPHELFRAAITGSTPASGVILAAIGYWIAVFVLTLGVYRWMIAPGGEP